MRIAFLIRAMSVGGAERQLTLLATGLAARGHQVSVLVFYRGGSLEADLAAGGVPVMDLAKRGRWDVLGFAARLRKCLNTTRPDVIYSFLPSANVLVAILGCAMPRLRIAWGVRSSQMSYDKRDWLGRLAAAFESRLARRAAAVICNSYAARGLQVARGVSQQKLVVIRNILDSLRYQRDEAARQRQREAWGISGDHVAIGIVGRLDPMKGHVVFLDAARRLAGSGRQIKFVIVGDGPSGFSAELRDIAQSTLDPDAVSWVPSQMDLVPVYSGLDIVCSASYSEGFSNVLCEAMACGCACVATDVGDSRDILGRFGRLTLPGDGAGLAEALHAVMDGLGNADRHGMRKHILSLCGRDAVLGLTQSVLMAAAAGLPLPECALAGAREGSQ